MLLERSFTVHTTLLTKKVVTVVISVKTVKKNVNTTMRMELSTTTRTNTPTILQCD